MTTSDKITDLVSSIDKMIPLLEKKIGLLKELRTVVMLADMMGVAPKDVQKVVRFRYEDDARSFSNSARPWTTMWLVITYENETKRFPLKDVDRRLWPVKVLDAWERWQATTRRPTN